MWHRSSVLLVLALLFSTGLAAQSSSKPATPKKKSASRVREMAGKIVDSVATSAAAMATDTILGGRAGTVAALVAGGQPGAPPTCPAGMVPYAPPNAAPAAVPGQAMPTSAGGAIIGAAKRRFGKKPTTEPAPTPAAPQYLCGTPQQAQAAQAQANQLGQQPKLDAGSMLAATPQGMMVTGAIAAAPMAGAAAKKLGDRFRRGQTSESMKKDLSGGKLSIKGIKFADGKDEMAPGFEQDLAALVEALSTTEGQFLLNVPAESDGKSAPDTALALRRMKKVAAHLLIAGITDDRVAVRGVYPSGFDPKSKAPKPGDTRIELMRVPAGLKL